MESLNNIILVFYIDIRNVPSRDLRHYMNLVKQQVAPLTPDNITMFFIPILSGDSRVECVNPKVISEDEYKHVLAILETNQKIVNDLVTNKNSIQPNLNLEDNK